MFADRNSRPSPGFRALLGRFLHGLLPHRLFQQLRTVWSYLMGPWDTSSILPSGWLIHRSVRSVELPEVLEALGLRSDSWEELGDCLDELPTPEVDMNLVKSWKGITSDKDESAFSDLTAWQNAMVHGNMVYWESGLTTWNDVAEPSYEGKECHKAAPANQACSSGAQMANGELEPCKVAREKCGTQLLTSSLDIISYILNVGAGGVLSQVKWKDQNIHVLAYPSKSDSEIQHICKKRLQLLQQNKTGEAFTSDVKKGDSKIEECPTIVPEHLDPMCISSHSQLGSNQNVDLSVSDCVKGQCQTCDQCELLSDISLTRRNVLEVPEINEKCSSSNQLPVLFQEVDRTDNLLHMCPPSPDKDQGYHSLEYWQCSPFLHNITNTNIEMPETCELDGEYVLSALPTGLAACASFGKNTNDDQSSKNTSCTNKHIGYILGTVVSDDDDTSTSSCDEWDKEEDGDDGFDSEGSVSTTNSETYVPEDALWNSFGSADPYNLQNLTASLESGVRTGENLLPLETPHKSWCESNAEFISDSEIDCSADEEENLKLWNSFLKSDDPYNPLYFKAPVQTSDTKRQSCEIASTYSVMVWKPLSNHKVTVTNQEYDLQQLQFKETHSMEDGADVGHKKVTFHEKVTIHYVCDEERKGHWEELARDRCRFQRRIKETEFVIGHCLTPDHRQRALNRMQGYWGS